MCSLYLLFLIFFTDLCCLVYSVVLKQTITMAGNDEIYVDLHDEDNTPDPNASMMAMLHSFQWEMAELRSQNDRLSLASEEQENIIRELALQNNQEGEGSRKRKTDDSKEDDAIRHQYKQKKELQGEFLKIKPPSYDGEKEEDAEALLLNMIKYFQVYEYEINLKAKLAIYQLQGKATLWWEETKMVHAIDEKIVTWEDFQVKFKNRYLNEHYYDDKEK